MDDQVGDRDREGGIIDGGVHVADRVKGIDFGRRGLDQRTK